MLAGGAMAQPVVGPYVSLGAGLNLLQDQNVKPSGAFGPVPRTYGFEDGLATNAAGGYAFGNGLRIEIEGDYTNNHTGSVTINGRDGYPVGREYQYGGFANVLYDFNAGRQVTPYIGAGVGYQQVDLDNINSALRPVLRNSGSESEGNFAYQAIAGLNFAVPAVPSLSFTMEYRFLGVTTPPSYDRGTPVFVDGTLRQSRATFSNIFNHELLLGVRYSFGAPPPPPPPAAQAAPPPPAPAVEAARTYLVFFDWDRADLTARAREIVAEAAAASTHVRTTRIEVSGYTDLSGTEAYNQRLSVRRAESVQAELERDGVSENEIDIHGYGESNPLVPTAKGVREPQNRRVEIVLK